MAVQKSTAIFYLTNLGKQIRDYCSQICIINLF